MAASRNMKKSGLLNCLSVALEIRKCVVRLGMFRRYYFIISWLCSFRTTRHVFLNMNGDLCMFCENPHLCFTCACCFCMLCGLEKAGISINRHPDVPISDIPTDGYPDIQISSIQMPRSPDAPISSQSYISVS